MFTPTLKPRERFWCVRWHKPQASFWKVNVDDAFFFDIMHTGIDMVLRDDLGVFVACKTMVLDTFYEVDEGKVLGLFEALF
ncbi:hypothetical protein ACS0TY_014893 [Phlomoides rotata]